MTEEHTIVRFDISHKSKLTINSHEAATFTNITQADICLRDISAPLQQLLSTIHLPSRYMLSLLWRIRLQRSIGTLEGRTSILRTQVQSALILLGCHQHATQLSSFFADKTDMLSAFIALAQYTTHESPTFAAAIPLDLAVYACHCLTAIVGSRDGNSSSIMGHFTWLQYDLGVSRGQYMGLIPCLLRNNASYLISLQTAPKPPDALAKLQLEWIEQIMVLIIGILNVPSALAPLTENGLILLFLDVLKVRPKYHDVTYKYIEVIIVQILETLISNYNIAMTLFKDHNAVDVIMERMLYETTYRSERRFYEAQEAFIYNLVNIYALYIQDGNDNRLAQLVRHPSLITFLSSIFERGAEHESYVLCSCYLVFANIINNEPGILPTYHNNELPTYMLRTFRCSANSEYLLSYVTCLSALCLTDESRTCVMQVSPFEELYAVFSMTSATGILLADLPSSLGSAVEELLRHYPQLSTQCLAAIIGRMYALVGEANAIPDTGKGISVEYIALLQRMCALVISIETLLLRKPLTSEFIALDGLPAMFSILQCAFKPSKYTITTLCCHFDFATPLGYPPMVKSLSRCLGYMYERDVQGLFPKLATEVSSAITKMKQALKDYCMVLGKEESFHMIIDTLPRIPLHIYNDNSLSPELLSYAKFAQAFLAYDVLVDSLSACLYTLMVREKSTLANSPETHALLSDVVDIYTNVEMELCRSRGAISSKNSHAQPIYHLLTIADCSVYPDEKPKEHEIIKKLYVIPKGCSVQAVERYAEQVNNIVVTKYRLVDGNVVSMTNGGNEQQIDIVDVSFNKDPVATTSVVAKSVNTYQQNEKTLEQDKFTNITPRRAGFMLFYRNHNSMRHLLSNMVWSLPVEHESITQFLPIVYNCLTKVLPQDDLLRTQGANTASIENNTLKVEAELPVPTMEMIPTTDAFRVIHLIELLYYLLFSDKKHRNDTNMILLLHIHHNKLLKYIIYYSSRLFAISLQHIRYEEGDGEVTPERLLYDRYMLVSSNIEIVLDFWKQLLRSYSLPGKMMQFLQKNSSDSNYFDLSIFKRELYVDVLQYILPCVCHKNIYMLQHNGIKAACDLHQHMLNILHEVVSKKTLETHGDDVLSYMESLGFSGARSSGNVIFSNRSSSRLAEAMESLPTTDSFTEGISLDTEPPEAAKVAQNIADVSVLPPNPKPSAMTLDRYKIILVQIYSFCDKYFATLYLHLIQSANKYDESPRESRTILFTNQLMHCIEMNTYDSVIFKSLAIFYLMDEVKTCLSLPNGPAKFSALYGLLHSIVLFLHNKVSAKNNKNIDILHYLVRHDDRLTVVYDDFLSLFEACINESEVLADSTQPTDTTATPLAWTTPLLLLLDTILTPVFVDSDTLASTLSQLKSCTAAAKKYEAEYDMPTLSHALLLPALSRDFKSKLMHLCMKLLPNCKSSTDMSIQVLTHLMYDPSVKKDFISSSYLACVIEHCLKYQSLHERFYFFLYIALEDTATLSKTMEYTMKNYLQQKGSYINEIGSAVELNIFVDKFASLLYHNQTVFCEVLENIAELKSKSGNTYVTLKEAVEDKTSTATATTPTSSHAHPPTNLSTPANTSTTVPKDPAAASKTPSTPKNAGKRSRSISDHDAQKKARIERRHDELQLTIDLLLNRLFHLWNQKVYIAEAMNISDILLLLSDLTCVIPGVTSYLHRFSIEHTKSFSYAVDAEACLGNVCHVLTGDRQLPTFINFLMHNLLTSEVTFRYSNIMYTNVTKEFGYDLFHSSGCLVAALVGRAGDGRKKILSEILYLLPDVPIENSVQMMAVWCVMAFLNRLFSSSVWRQRQVINIAYHDVVLELTNMKIIDVLSAVLYNVDTSHPIAHQLLADVALRLESFIRKGEPLITRSKEHNVSHDSTLTEEGDNQETERGHDVLETTMNNIDHSMHVESDSELSDEDIAESEEDEDDMDDDDDGDDFDEDDDDIIEEEEEVDDIVEDDEDDVHEFHDMNDEHDFEQDLADGPDHALEAGHVVYDDGRLQVRARLGMPSFRDEEGDSNDEYMHYNEEQDAVSVDSASENNDYIVVDESNYSGSEDDEPAWPNNNIHVRLDNDIFRYFNSDMNVFPRRTLNRLAHRPTAVSSSQTDTHPLLNTHARDTSRSHSMVDAIMHAVDMSGERRFSRRSNSDRRWAVSSSEMDMLQSRSNAIAARLRRIMNVTRIDQSEDEEKDMEEESKDDVQDDPHGHILRNALRDMSDTFLGMIRHRGDDVWTAIEGPGRARIFSSRDVGAFGDITEILRGFPRGIGNSTASTERDDTASSTPAARSSAEEDPAPGGSQPTNQHETSVHDSTVQSSATPMEVTSDVPVVESIPPSTSNEASMPANENTRNGDDGGGDDDVSSDEDDETDESEEGGRSDDEDGASEEGIGEGDDNNSDHGDSGSARETGEIQRPDGVDPEIWESLPDALRLEIYESYREVNAADTELDRDVLAALPSELRQEALQGEAMERRRRESMESNVDDNMAFLNTLSPELRADVLLSADEAFLQTLPEEVRAEARGLRSHGGRHIMHMNTWDELPHHEAEGEEEEEPAAQEKSAEMEAITRVFLNEDRVTKHVPFDRAIVVKLVMLLSSESKHMHKAYLKLFSTLCRYKICRRNILLCLMALAERNETMLTENLQVIPTQRTMPPLSISNADIVTKKVISALSYIHQHSSSRSVWFDILSSNAKEYWIYGALLNLLGREDVVVPTTLEVLLLLLEEISESLSQLSVKQANELAGKQLQQLHQSSFAVVPDTPQEKKSSADEFKESEFEEGSAKKRQKTEEPKEEGPTSSVAPPSMELQSKDAEEILFIPFPILDKSHCKTIAAASQLDICSGALKNRFWRIVRALALYDMNWRLLLEQLAAQAQKVVPSVVDEVQNLHRILLSVQGRGTATSAMMLPELTSPGRVPEVQLLQLLKMMTTLRTCDTIVDPVVAGYLQTIEFGGLWTALCSCMDDIRHLEGIYDIDMEAAEKQPNEISSLIMRFMSLIECFLIACSSSVVAVDQEKDSSKRKLETVESAGTSSECTAQPSTAVTVASEIKKQHTTLLPGYKFRQHAEFKKMCTELNQSALSQLFLQFMSKNHILLNNILKHNINLLDSSFALLVYVPKCRNLLHFDVKRAYFKLKLKAIKQSYKYTTTKLVVRRNNIFEDSFQKLRYCSTADIHKKLHIVFHNEQGVDAGGLTREWYSVLSKEIFNPNYALFVNSTHDNVTFQPNPLSYVNEAHLDYFKFVGRIIGKAICDGFLLDVHFTRSFYKHMLGLPIQYHDLEAIEPDFYKSLQMILNTPLDDLGLDLTFSTESTALGHTETIDLIEGGRNKYVTDEDKLEYVRLIAHHRMTAAIRKQVREHECCISVI